MEDGREVITVEDIKQQLSKMYIHDVIVSSVYMGLLCLFLLIFIKYLIIKLLIAGLLLSKAYFIVKDIREIQKIRNGTYFTIRTDELVAKQDHVYGGLWRDDGRWDKLIFRMGTYMLPHPKEFVSAKVFIDDPQTLFDTAFIGDSFTLIEHKNTILLVYNNKLYDVQIPE